jgi:osmoprotectant transport system permease protein
MRRVIVFLLILFICIGVTIWITNMDKIGFMEPFTYGEILKEAQRHLNMVLLTECLVIGIGVPLGILLTRQGFRALANPVIGIANAGQSIPSLAVVVIMVPIVGLGFWPAIIALFIWGLLPILRNSYAAINNINPAIVEAARGMGMTKVQIARKVELPLALPVIVTGIRVSTVVVVGTATLAALIAAGGLGRIILAGVRTGQPLLTLQGAAPTAAMAVVLGYILELIERWITPRGLKVKTEIV